MSFPTIRGKPWFDTTGTWAQIYVYVDTDVPTGAIVTLVRVWGTSTLTSKCVNASKNSSPNFTYGAAGGITLPWNNLSPVYFPASWVHWDYPDPYFRICVELTYSIGSANTVLHKCGVWEAILEGDYPPTDLVDCMDGDNLTVVPHGYTIQPLALTSIMAKSSRAKLSRGKAPTLSANRSPRRRKTP